MIVLLGIVTGTCIAATFGEMLVSWLGSFMGAAHIKFVVNPIVSYIICPAILFISVTATTLFSSFTMKQTNDVKPNGGVGVYHLKKIVEVKQVNKTYSIDGNANYHVLKKYRFRGL